MTNYKEFQKLYLLARRTGRNCLDSYSLAERIYKKRTGKRAYKNYITWANVMSRRQRRKN